MRGSKLLSLPLLLLAACALEPHEMEDVDTSAEAIGPLPKLGVSSNGRYLVKSDGSPFFYLADTAWELFHRLNRSEVVTYLDNRAAREYTVIQAVAVAELDGVNTPNAHGDKPFLNNNPATPDTTAGADPSNATQYDYWDHVDYIVDQAEARGIYTAFLPTWGSHVLNGTINASNAQAYGQFLGSRYANKAVIWVLGGDRSPVGYEAVWRAMAKGIAIGVSGAEDYTKTLMTYHPPGGATSATWFHNEAWLDFNMQQNGHCSNTDVWNRLGNDHARTPTKPVMDGEPLYEQHPICFNAPTYGYSDDYEIRKFAYWDVFSGAHGHTYGHHSVWQMYAPNRSGVNGPVNTWYEAINQPGAAQMKFVRRLVEARPFLVRTPDQTVLATSAGSGTNRVQATRGSDGSYAFVYSASGQAFSVNMSKISGGTVRASWYDPRNGTSSEIGTFPNTGVRQFSPPSSGYGNDWVLVLDDTTKNFPLPGDPPPPPPPPPPPGALYRAINLNGSATVIDGQSWEGSDAPNYTYSGTPFANQSVALNPATDANRAAMIRSSVWSTSAAVNLLSVPNGTYTVYLHTWEDNAAETFSIFLEGGLVKANHYSGSAGSWSRLGPWTVAVSDGALNLTTSGGAANLSGIEVYGAGGGFVRGVNFNGGAVTIDGNAWQSYSSALASGLTVNAPSLTTTSVTPSPAASSDTSAMLNSAIWKQGADLNVGQQLANGNYQVYLWVMENYQSNYRSFKIRLEGTDVASAAGNLPLSSWAKYGPYDVQITDGVLNVDLVRVNGDPHLMGMAIFN